jgi:rRNA-processing protein FCF1
MDKRNIRMELSDVELLPDDFNKKSPDNNILTVALKYKNDNPILLTSDNGLQVKTKGLGISTISLRDFLKR